MYQQSGSSIFDGFAQAPATASSHGTGYNNYNPHLMTNPNSHFMANPNPHLIADINAYNIAELNSYFMTNPNPHLIVNPNSHLMTYPNHNLMNNPNPHLMTNPNPRLLAKPNPRLMAKPNPRLMAKPNPRLMAKPNPRLMAKPNPRLMTNPNPRLMANPNLRLMATPNPRLMTNPNPRLMANPNFRLMTNPNPRLMTNPNPRLMANPNPRLMTNPNPRLMANPNPRLMTNPNPRLMAKPNPRLMANSNPRLMTNPYPRLMTNPNVGAMVSINPYLPPPPSYFSPHLMNSVAVRSEPSFLVNWCVSVNNVKFDDDNTSLIAELRGTLLANDGRTVLYENYCAGRIISIISHNIVKTNTGVYHLVGPICQGYPNNLYRACLEANGIPKTWKYILTQFSGKPKPADIQNNQIAAASVGNDEVKKMGEGVQELIKSYRILQRFATVAENKARELQKGRQPISFMRHQFHEKVTKSLKTLNTQIILGLKAILKH